MVTSIHTCSYPIKIVAMALSLVATACIAGGSAAVRNGQLGAEIKAPAATVAELLAKGARHTEDLAVAEGELWVESEDHSLCPVGRKNESFLRGDCLWLSLSWSELGGDEKAVLKVLEQWNGYRVRVEGGFRKGPAGHFGLYGGELLGVSSMVLLEDPDTVIFGIDEIDLIPPPKSPHMWSGKEISAYRCYVFEYDDEGRLMCLDRFEPWVWVETEEGFIRTEYEDPSGEIAESITALEIVADGRFIAIADDLPISGPEVATLFGWDGKGFVPLGQDVLYSSWSYDGGLYFYAEVDRDESGTAVESRVFAVDSSFRPLLVWQRDGAEVVELFHSGPDEAEIEFVESEEVKSTIVGGQWLGASPPTAPELESEPGSQP